MKGNKAIIFLFSVLLSVSCQEGKALSPSSPHSSSIQESDELKEALSMTLMINNKTYKGVLAENETAQAFEVLCPMTLEMNELNGNENTITSIAPSEKKNPAFPPQSKQAIFSFLVIVALSFFTRISKPLTLMWPWAVLTWEPTLERPWGAERYPPHSSTNFNALD